VSWDPWSVDLYNALLANALVNITDIITTYNVLRKHGVSRELNPIAYALFKRFGIAGGFILKYLVIGATLLLVALTNPRALVLTVWMWNIVLAGAVAWNSYVNLRDHLEEQKSKG
jgi:hypothetical protein